MTRPVTYREMREHAATLHRRAEDLEAHSSRRFDSAPGAFVTGGSGRGRSGLAKRTARAIDGSLADLRKAKALRESAAKWSARADRLDPMTVEAIMLRRAARAEMIASAERAESERRKASPILNRPIAGAHLNAAEWAAIPSDYKRLTLIEVDGSTCRVRTAMRGGALEEVYLTDRKTKAAP